jgi:DNA-binding NarL/FixJ family response regulator
MEKELFESVSKKLSVLIALNLLSGDRTITQNIEMLARFGLTATEIAEILNTSPNTVNVTKSRIKSNKKAK